MIDKILISSGGFSVEPVLIDFSSNTKFCQIRRAGTEELLRVRIFVRIRFLRLSHAISKNAGLFLHSYLGCLYTFIWEALIVGEWCLRK